MKTEVTTAQPSVFKVSTIGFLVMFILGLYVWLASPFAPGLSALGHKVLMALIFTIGMWVFKPWGIPFSVGGSLFLLLTMAFGVPMPKVFSGFTSPALWTLIPALFFGYVLVKTGLGKRLAFLALQAFKPSYPMLILAFVLIGLALSALTPSITVRCVIIIPIAVSVIEACKLDLKSSGSALLLLSAWVMAVVPGTGWLTGSLHGPIIMGMFGSVPDLKDVVTFGSWSQTMLLPAELLSALLIVGGYFALKPDQPITLAKEYFTEEYRKLGSFSKDEIYSIIILTACFVMFVTGRIHKIPDPATCLGGLFLLTLAGVLKASDISPGISWDLVMFIGIASGFGAVFAETGVSKWLVGVLVPLIKPLTASPWLFCYSLLLAFFALRFFDVAVFIPTMAVLVPIIPEIAKNFGINPMVWVCLFVMAANCFLMSYTNMFALVAESIAKDRSWTPAQFTRYGIVYCVACLITLAVAIPYWTSIGMFR